MRHNGADKQQTGTTHLQTRAQKWCLLVVEARLVALFECSPYAAPRICLINIYLAYILVLNTMPKANIISHCCLYFSGNIAITDTQHKALASFGDDFYDFNSICLRAKGSVSVSVLRLGAQAQAQALPVCEISACSALRRFQRVLRAQKCAMLNKLLTNSSRAANNNKVTVKRGASWVAGRLGAWPWRCHCHWHWAAGDERKIYAATC